MASTRAKSSPPLPPPLVVAVVAMASVFIATVGGAASAAAAGGSAASAFVGVGFGVGAPASAPLGIIDPIRATTADRGDARFGHRGRHRRRGLGLRATSPPSSSTSNVASARPNGAAAKTKTTTARGGKKKSYQHTLAVLTFPRTSSDHIANEAVLMKAVDRTHGTLSVVLRCRDNQPHRTPLADLRTFLGDVYSTAWDAATEKVLDDDDADADDDDLRLLDVVVYPQSLPNAPPERWIYCRPDLECVCGADDMLGWHSVVASSSSSSDSSDARSGSRYVDSPGDGLGGLACHADAVNAIRVEKGLGTVEALEVDLPPGATSHPDVVFLEDDTDGHRGAGGQLGEEATSQDDFVSEEDDLMKEDKSLGLLGGARPDDSTVFSNVAVGGTFDGMHYGHRKLLTLAVSSVEPNSGRLLVGVTADEMLTRKELSDLIPPLEERMDDVRKFLDKLAPGLKNRRKIVPIYDAFGPPGKMDEGKAFDALVLSHETLGNGHALNEERMRLGLEPLKLLCTRRTEPNGMSSTALRRMKDAR